MIGPITLHILSKNLMNKGERKEWRKKPGLSSECQLCLFLILFLQFIWRFEQWPEKLL